MSDKYPNPLPGALFPDGRTAKLLRSGDELGFVVQSVVEETGGDIVGVMTFAKQPGENHGIAVSRQAVEIEPDCGYYTYGANQSYRVLLGVALEEMNPDSVDLLHYYHTLTKKSRPRTVALDSPVDITQLQW